MQATVEIPFVTVDQMRAVSKLMVEVYGISLIQTMENAGRNLARAARRIFLGGNPQGKRIVVLAGSGGNGGAISGTHAANGNLGLAVDAVFFSGSANIDGYTLGKGGAGAGGVGTAGTGGNGGNAGTLSATLTATTGATQGGSQIATVFADAIGLSAGAGLTSNADDLFHMFADGGNL